MTRGYTRLFAALAAALCVAAGILVPSTASQAAPIRYDTLVSGDPAPVTPNVLDGKVRMTATVDGVTVAVGNFTQVQERGSATVLPRQDIFAFDANGQVSTTFVPAISGTEVYDVIPSGDGTSVYIGGNFSNVGGVSRTGRVARIDVHTGAILRTFKAPGFDQRVTDLQLANGKLYVGGWFAAEGTTPRTLLAELDPTTGVDTGNLNLQFAGTWNGGTTGVTHMNIAPDGRTMVVVGNFTSVEGQRRPQIAMVDLSTSPASLSSWQTEGFAKTCSSHFRTYVNDVDIDPTSSYFVVGTTGAYSGGPGAGSLCDAISRFELGRTGANQAPTWVHYTGGDTVTEVEAVGNAIYIGGHFRWLNNPFVGDRPGPGNVKRQGLGALDPRNGQPFTWAPDMRRGWGVFGMNATPDGLWVLYDSSAMNGQDYQRIAFFPNSSAVVPPERAGVIPGDIYQLGSPPSPAATDQVLYRVNAGGPTLLADDGGPDWRSDNATSVSPNHNTGSSASEYNTEVARSANLPDTTPTGIFGTERWDPSSQPEMSWDFGAPSGTPLQVRLYFGNQCSCTNAVGKRIFNVTIDNTKVLSNFDIVADSGNLVGTMKAFNIVSDGNVDIDFGHVKENPLVNGIEIVRTDVPETPPAPDEYARVATFDGAQVTQSSTAPITLFTSNWRQARGAFMVDDRLYTGWSDGTLKRRTWNGSKFLGAVTIPGNELGAWIADLQNIRTMFYDTTTGRIYYTLAGQNQLYYRYFTTQSSIVGAQRFAGPAAIPGLDWSQVRGSFLTGDALYVTSPDGTLSQLSWVAGAPVSGTLSAVSGPNLDGQDWRSQALFLFSG